MTGQSRLSLSSLSSSIHSSLFRPFSPSIYIYMSRHGAPRERGTRVDRRRIKPMRSLQLCSLSFSLSPSFSPWLRTIRCIRRRAHYKTGEYKRQRWVETDPPTWSSTEQASSSSHPAGNLLSSYFNISRNSANTQLFFLSFYSSFSFSFFFFVSFPFPFFVSVFSFLFFPCSPFFGSSRYAAVVSYLVDDVFAPLLKIF